MIELQLKRLLTIGCVLALTFPVMVHAQDDSSTSTDDSSDRTEESEEAYRRRMELEGARDSETYADTSYGSQVEQEKIDKLPRESQDNIRDQITDIIIENDEWEPSDVLDDYPYEPTEAAKDDPALRDQEEEAWAEQVDKYHEREAGAFGATRPPMPGDPGQPGSPGSQGNDQQAGGQPGGGQNGSEGESESQTAGGFNPGQAGSPSSEDEVSTAGVSESALDFLRGQRGQSPVAGAGGGSNPEGQPGATGGGNTNTPQQNNPALAEAGADQQQAEQAEDPASEDSQSADSQPQQGGILPIEQLGQLQGVESQPPGQPSGGQTNPTPPGAQNQASPPSGVDSAPAAGQSQSQASESSASAADELVAQNEPGTEPPSEEQSADAAEQSEQQATDQLTQAEQQAADPAQNSEEEAQEASPDLQLQTPGIIAITDLEKLEGVEETEVDPP